MLIASRPASETAASPVRVLAELHYCLQGFSGIAQETRLLFAELAAMPGIAVGGLIDPQSDLRAAGARRDADTVLGQVRLVSEIDRLTSPRKRGKSRWQAIAGQYRKSPLGKLARRLGNRTGSGEMLFPLEPSLHGDLIWDKLFARTLAPEHRANVLASAFFGIRTGRRTAAETAPLPAWNARIDTAGWDVLIAQTPFPYRLAAGTSLLVRYHDAIPVLHPHTLSEGEIEATRHYRVLKENARQGAFFACDSEPVRADLLRLAPQAERRAEVIPAMASPQFWPDPAPPWIIEEILRLRACPPAALGGASAPEGGMDPAAESGAPTFPADRRFFLAVSTLEPRKNYRILIDAWVKVRRRLVDPPALVLVAGPGWRYDDDAAAIALWRGRGLFHLWRVPIEELRLLSSSAQAMICPSLAEGFDLSGVEAMLCDTPVIASGIPVHRWVYGDAALYFDPFDADDLARLLDSAATQSKEEGALASLRARGSRQGALYRPDAIAPQWQALLDRVHRTGS